MKIPVIFNKYPTREFELISKRAKNIFNKLSETDKLFTNFCPYCGAPLKATDRLEYLETNDEDIFCKPVSKKIVYKCSHRCPESYYAKWNSYGESYIDDISCKPDYSYLAFDIIKQYNKRIFKTMTSIPDALGSFWAKINFSSYAPGKKTKYEFQFFKNQKFIPVIQKSYQYNEFGEAKYFTLSFYTKVKHKTDSYYVYKKSFIDILLSHINITRNVYRLYKEDPTETRLKQLYGFCDDQDVRYSYKGFTKFWYKRVIPFVFGTLMGIKLSK